MGLRKEDSILTRRKLPLYGSAPRGKLLVPTPENPIMISASELRDFLRCRVKWFWRYQVQRVPKDYSVPLLIGGIGHEMLASWYKLRKKERTIRAMKAIAKARMSQTRPRELKLKDFEMLKAMMIGYAAWARQEDRPLKMGRTKTERWFELPLNPERTIIIRGFIDVVFPVGSLKKTLGCLEHKLQKNLSTGMLDVNLQVSVYLWALRQLYPNYKRYIAYFNVLRKQMPGPRVTAPLFGREPIERSGVEIDQWSLDIQRAAMDMLDAAIYPNPMDSCAWSCDYQIPCLLRGNEEDLKHIFKTQFKRKVRR